MTYPPKGDRRRRFREEAPAPAPAGPEGDHEADDHPRGAHRLRDLVFPPRKSDDANPS